MNDISKMMTSIDQDWATPQSFVDLVAKKFNIKFEVDVCAYNHTTKCKVWYTEEDDALTQSWHRVSWMNPPYGQAIPTWLKYAKKQNELHKQMIVCLVPARTDTVWFHDAAAAADIILLKGRIAFERANGVDTEHKPGAFGSMLVIFNNTINPSISTWEWKKENVTP